jgi:hypothetical protein
LKYFLQALRALFKIGGFATEEELKTFVNAKAKDGRIAVADFKVEMRRRQSMNPGMDAYLRDNAFAGLARENVTDGKEIEDILKCLKEKLLGKELAKWKEVTGISLSGRVDASSAWAKATKFAR